MPKLKQYPEVQKFLADVLSRNNEDASAAIHGAFWATLSYDNFVNGNVPGVKDPTTKQPMKILIKGNSAQSNIILALRGASGTPFDPNTGAFGQMPGDGPPFFATEEIEAIADWIDSGCPQ